MRVHAESETIDKVVLRENSPFAVGAAEVFEGPGRVHTAWARALTQTQASTRQENDGRDRKADGRQPAAAINKHRVDRRQQTAEQRY
jgi:hypothetical protein